MSDLPTSFADLGLSESLLKAVAGVGYETPSPIQAACIPQLMQGADLLGEAQTGTGKTAAFALPALSRVDIADLRPQVLVLAPTRELAIQVAEAFQKYAAHTPGFHVLPIYGGQSMVVQLRQLKRGAQVIVGTPGRVMDHIERESLDLSNLKMLVLDEADEMLRMGFIDDVEWILQHTPNTRQTALFSATMPDQIRRVAHQYLKNPHEVKIKAATSTVQTISQRYWLVRGVNKLDALTRILEAEEDLDAAIIFVRTKIATEELADKLEARGHAAAAINGDMNQGMRERVIEQLKNGTLDILIATDVAARGIDVPRITHVINYDIPYDTEAYVHRIGRTGRAGRQGTAVLFVAPRERGMLKAIERATRQPIEPIALPTLEDVQGRRISQLKQEVLNAIAGEDMQYFGEVLEQLATDTEMESSDLAAALLFLAQRDRPLKVEESGHGWDVATSPAQVSSARPGPERTRPGEPPQRRERPSRADFQGEGATRRYRIEVGRMHGVSPKEIVGAIANEGGIDGRFIGQIDLFDDFSTVELPSLGESTLSALQRTRVRAQPLSIRELGEHERYEKPRRAAFGQERFGNDRRPNASYEEGRRGFRRDDDSRPARPRWGGDSQPAQRDFSDRPRSAPRDQDNRAPRENRDFRDSRPQRDNGFGGSQPPRRSPAPRSEGGWRDQAPRDDRRQGDRPAGGSNTFKGARKKSW